jgi:hypothetical protein
MDVNKFAAAGFFFTALGDVVRCAFCQVESDIGLKEMMHLRSISAGVYLAGLLMGCL